MNQVLFYIYCFIFLLGIISPGNINIISGQEVNNNISGSASASQDTTSSSSTRLPLFEKQSNNPFVSAAMENAIELQPDSNSIYTSKFNPKTGLVYFYRKIDHVDVLLPYTMTMDEYMDEDFRKSMMAYWQTRALSDDATSKKGFDAADALGLNNLFGSDLIKIKAQGTAKLSVGITQTNIDNPTLTEEQRKTTTFDFDEQIQMNINGTIGDKLKLGINYNTEATFDFENEMKLEYAGKEDDIIQSIEAGNVSLSLPGTLITGSQSLFGIKTDLKFGKLTVSTVIAQQKGETYTLDTDDGAQSEDFEIQISDYDKNRHFFLSNYFRDLYDKAQSSYPINSKIVVTKVEVWETNSTSDYSDARDIMAFMDLGETGDNVYNSSLWGGNTSQPPANSANTLYSSMNSTYSAIRDISNATSTLKGISDFSSGRDYEKVEKARLLSSSEYTLNKKLGFISLSSALSSDQVLAVAFEYTYNGTTYKVGELTSSSSSSSNALYVKLLKSSNLTPKVKPTWDLMMKNIYSLGAYQVEEDDFECDIAYLDDDAGTYVNYFPGSGSYNGKLFLRMMKLDRLDTELETNPDGIFDFIDGQTINATKGKIIFPEVEPFGSYLASLLGDDSEYVYQALYDSTQTVAQELTEKDKFYLTGTYSSSVSNEITLDAQNLTEGSVTVTAGGITLTENEDYTVDYTYGTVTIINDGLLESGTDISVSVESNSLYNTQTKTLMGTHLNYQFNDKFNLGGTFEYLREQPMTQKVNVGSEPVANSMFGLDATYTSDSQWLTDALNKLPVLNLNDPSNINFFGEFAYLNPGTPNIIEGQSYIDDFEGSETSIDMRNYTAWSLASAPQGQDDLIPNADETDDLSYGYQRAKLAWYTIDPLFTRSTSTTPSYIKNDLEQQSNHYVRSIYEEEIWPEKDETYGTSTRISVFDLAYYPKERGPYNYTTDIAKDGSLNNPEDNWAGIQREVGTTDFESANVEYIEFWMLDPFIYDQSEDRAGDLYFDLGSVSEDVLNDSEKFFEQGLPGPDDDDSDVDSTVWGYYPTASCLTYAFSTDADERVMQDIGFDGLSSDDEVNFFSDYIEQIKAMYTAGNLSDSAYEAILDDPSSDDYRYFRGTQYDEDKASILERYKDYNGTEGNSVPSSKNDESYATAATTTPDMEDINQDNTLSETEAYYQYKVHLDPSEMTVGSNYINDIVESSVELANGNTETVKWYQFRIPIEDPDETIGDISDFSSIKFMRMFVHGFADTTILRFATLDLVRSEWKKYSYDLTEDDETVNENANTTFTTGTVNIEENSDRTPINYVLPPGVDRVIDPSNPQVQELNEQSVTIEVTDLPRNERKAIYKSVDLDLRHYGTLKMFVHAEEETEGSIGDNNVRAFIRLGTDNTSNYYEYEVPLEMTAHGSTDDDEIWPEANRFVVDLTALPNLKLERNNSDYDTDEVYTKMDGDNWMKVKGSPSLADVQVIMLGVRSTLKDEDVSFTTWFNELRVSDFDNDGGWAARGQMDVKLSDLGTVSLAGSKSTAGFGTLDSGIGEREDEDNGSFDMSTNLELAKFLGDKTRMTIPFYYSQSKEVTTPEYYPLMEDVKLQTVLDNASSAAERDSIKNISQTVVERKSLNLTNVKLKPKTSAKGKKNRKTKIYDISNVSATYSYSEKTKHSTKIEHYIDKDFKGVLSYNFTNKPKNYEPFKNVDFLKGGAFQIIRDFNFYLMPTQISLKSQLTRSYTEKKLRNTTNPDFVMPTTVSKDFTWNRDVDFAFNFTKNLKFSFSTSTEASIDEPDGVVSRDSVDTYEAWKDSVYTNILKGGRTTDYGHEFDLSYTLPINKLPLLKWTNFSTQYHGEYAWEIAPSSTDESIDWGNTISNANTIQGTALLNFKSLYNQSKYLKGLQRKYDSKSSSRHKSKKRTVRYNENNITLKKGVPYIINHKLKSTEARVRVFDSNGRTARGKTSTINDKKSEFIPEADYDKARILVTAIIEDKNTPLNVAMDYAAMLATSVKSLSLNYSESNSTELPGFLPGTGFLGAGTYDGMSAPGYKFLLGLQDRDFAQKAGDNGWLTRDTINEAYEMTHSENFTIKTTIQPFKTLKIDLNAYRRYNKSISEYYIYDGETDRFNANSPTESGSYSMTYNIISTAFDKTRKKGSYNSAPYNKFLDNRDKIKNRLVEKRKEIYPNYTDEESDDDNPEGYSDTSPEVLIPAFLAAYSGQNADNIFMNLIPSLAAIQPNWKVTYSGLSDLPFFKRYMKSFDLSHSYKSIYSISSYSTNSDYEEDETGFCWDRNETDNLFITKYDYGTVSLTETFSPLLGLNITWNNSLTSKLQMNKKRILSLSLTNNQLTENLTNEWVVGLGYKFDKMDIILGGVGKKQKKWSSDLDLSLDFSIKDNLTILREIEEETDELSAGQKVATIKFTADYALSKSFTMQLYYDRVVNNPYISTSYPTKTTDVGVSFTFSLSQNSN